MDHPVSGPVALVLTATITPFVSFVELNDSSQRLNNYLDALRFYISNCDFPIYFVENSGYPMEESTEFNNWCKSGRVQWIKATPHPDHSKGKGFQEFYMLDQVMDIIEHDFARIIKITGRYQVKNFLNLMEDKLPLSMDLHRKKKIAITSFFTISTSFYQKHFKGCFSDADDDKGIFIEHVIYKIIRQKKLLQEVSLFSENPIVAGIPGSYSGNLQRHPLKMKTRNLERKLLKFLGFHEFLLEY